VIASKAAVPVIPPPATTSGMAATAAGSSTGTTPLSYTAQSVVPARSGGVAIALPGRSTRSPVGRIVSGSG
jgi:chaperone required for assembly of F1-ATPase